MADRCEVYLCVQAEKALDKYRRKDPKRAVRIENMIDRVRSYGWGTSRRIELIKELDKDNQVGEIRDLGKGGTRLIFFWADTTDEREIYVTDIPKKGILTDTRLKRFTRAAVKRRDHWLKTGEC